MQASLIPLALGAARSVASSFGLNVDDVVILQDSNRVTLRLLPCDVLARVALAEHKASAKFEVEVVRRLAETESPTAIFDPRVPPKAYMRDGFVVTLWRYYELATPQEVAPAEYAGALVQLHAGFRQIDLAAPHFSDRSAWAQRLVDDRSLTPELGEADRELLSTTLRKLTRTIRERATAEQLLHGEPHPGNLLRTQDGLRFIDFETVCRGPVEFDVADAPEDVSKHYPGLDDELLRECRVLILAMVAAWRWDREDDFPGGREMGIELLSQLRADLARFGIDIQA